MLHEYMSNEEWYFSLYLDELVKAGFINGLQYQPKSFKICDPVKLTYKGYGKRKGEFDKHVTLLHGSEYTADWAWHWDISADGIFFTSDKRRNPKDFPFIPNRRSSVIDDIFFSVIDVKGTFDSNNNVRMFSMNQKIIYEKYNIYVQAIVPKPTVSVDKTVTPEKTTIRPKSAIFLSTFCPARYLLTDGAKAKRKILFETRTITQFVDEQRNRMETLSEKLQAENQS